MNDLDNIKNQGIKIKLTKIILEKGSPLFLL